LGLGLGRVGKALGEVQEKLHEAIRAVVALEVGYELFSEHLVVRKTDFRLPKEATDVGIQEIYRQLARDESRNQLIFDDVLRALEAGRSPIILTERRDHLDDFAERLRPFTRNLIVLRGGMRTKERRAALERLASLSESEERLVLATGRFIGEGFDDARLDTLFLAMPISWKGTIVQYSGRLHRKHHAKSEVRIMDYVDHNVPMLARMFEKRMRGYRAMGYSVGDYSPGMQDRRELVVEYDEDAGVDPDYLR
jgi:superfamily II DNA or RNA helicase